MSFWSHLGDVLWWMLTAFVFIAYLMALFSILGDLFRDTKVGGGKKALWLVFLVFLPFLTALVYLIVRGRGMAVRSQQHAERAQQAAEDYIRSVAGNEPSGVEQIAQAKRLLDDGVITQEEFDRLKQHALQAV